MQKHYNYLNIDLDKKIHTKLKAKQGDSKSRYILVNLISNSTYYDLTGTTVKIYGIKKDKTIFFNHATVTNSKQGQFEVELTTQALAVPGEIEIQILILGTTGERLTTFSFFINVEKTIIDDTAIESTNEFTALTEALSSVQNIDNRFREVDEQFNTKANKEDVAKISSGTPLFASSTTEMTDTTKNYVNTTDGFLYIYNNGSWEKSTVKYQSSGIEDNYIDVGMLNKYVRDYIGMDKLIDFQIGNIGNNGELSTRVEYNNIVSKNIINGLNTRITIKNPNMARVKITYYDDEGNFLKNGSWTSEEIIIEENSNIRIGICLYELLGLDVFKYTVEEMLDMVSITETSSLSEKVYNNSKKIDDLKPKLDKVYDNYIKNNYIHISFDDTELCFKNLTSKGSTYNSLFDEPFLAKLKELHDIYGAVFSLYVYNTCLSNVPTKFKQDFIDNSRWLKIGFHTQNATKSYADATREVAQQDYNEFINTIYPIVGGHNSIDRIPRLNYFEGSSEAVLGLRDCNVGILGLLSADDSRQTYYFNDEQLAYLRVNDKLDHLQDGLVFFSTDMRLDWFNPSFSTVNEYNKPVKDSVYEELKYRYGQPNMADLYKSLIVFTHEWQIYNGTTLTSNASWLEDVCKFGNDFNFDFDFPQNRISGGITSFKLAFDTIKSLILE